MSSSNPFRRKETQILGLDNSSFVSSNQDIASAVARIPDADSASVKSDQRRAHLTSEPEDVSEDEDSYHATLSRVGNRSEYARSQHSHPSPTEGENTFSEVSDEDDDGDEFDGGDFPPRRKGRRLVPYKAHQALNVDWDNPWRNSTAMGNLPGTGKHGEQNSTAIPPKAQRTLGMSRTGRTIDEEGYRRENSLSPQTENVAPKALRTLGIPSNPFQRPQTADSQSIHGDDGDRLSLASAAHRQMDADEFKRLLLSGHRAPPFDNSSSTDVSSNSRSSMLSSQSYRETPRSSHEILPEELNMRAYGRLTHRSPVSLISNKSRTDSINVDPAAVLTEPFSPMSSLAPESPVELNKPLPHRPETIFELPAHVPGSHYGPSHDTFVAELPASEPIAELPHNTFEAVELPDNEIMASPMSAASSLRTGSVSSPFRAPGLTRAATSGYPNVAELASANPVELPTHPTRATPLHHARTLPSMHAASQHAPPPPPLPPSRISSLPKRVNRVVVGGMQPPSNPPRSSNPDHQSALATILPHYDQPRAPLPSKLNTLVHSTSTTDIQPGRGKRRTSKPQEGNIVDKPAEAEKTIPSTKKETPNATAPSTSSETSASPCSPSGDPAGSLGTIAKAAIIGAPRKGSATSLRSLEVPAAISEARRKGSSTSLGEVKNSDNVVLDIAALQKDVESLRDKIGIPKDSINTRLGAGHGTPPEAVETGKLGEPASVTSHIDEKDEIKTEEKLRTSEIERAVQSAADEAAAATSREHGETSETKHALHLDRSSSSSSDDTTPKASDAEGPMRSLRPTS